MAHLIDFETGQAAFTYARKPGWHQLGYEMTPEEQADFRLAAKKSHCDFIVEDVELFYKSNGELLKVDDSKGIRRTDSGLYLATVGSGYTPIQNLESFEIAQPLIDMGCRIDVMGSIKNGRNVWLLLRMPDAKMDVFGDIVDGFMLIRNAHDGSAALTGQATGVRVVCNNTMQLAEASPKYSVVRISHTKSAKEKVAVARQIMEQTFKAMEEAGSNFRKLAEYELDQKQILGLVEKVLPQPEDKESDTVTKRRIAIVDLMFNGAGNKHWATLGEKRATAWAVLNGFTEYFDHERPTEAKSISAKRSALESSLFGANALVKNKVMKNLMDLVLA